MQRLSIAGSSKTLSELKRYRPLFAVAVIACIVSGGVYPSQSIIFAKSVTVFQYTGDTLVQNGTFWALMWFVLAVIVCLAFGIMGTSFTLVAAVVSHHYRWEYFAALLRQDASFFFKQGDSPGSLVAQLTFHTQQLQDLVSNSLGLILVVVVNLVPSCALSLAETWRLGLVAITGSLSY